MPVVYILHSEKLDRFYVGFTENLEVRIDFHLNDTQTRKLTYNADDWKVFLKIRCQSKTQGLKIEKHIKSMKSKIYIQNLKAYPEITHKLFLKYPDC